MQQIPYPSRRAWKRRALSLLLALVMILGLVPGIPGGDSEASAHWADPYLSQLMEWGFISASQANNPDRALTRADFMAIVNRAYGYHEPGETPFEDVDEKDWYYDDVGVAYTARYIKGTSPTTASPNSPLTRETAATILGRNMMLQDSVGEILDFTDARQISSWAKGTIKSSLEHYLISGYDDGTFRPQRNVSWGEMAAMLTSIVGTPLQEPGDYALGGTFGNITITSPGVILRDTVVSGDLYITGGVGLGGVTLENVTVLGRIIASGTGQSEIGESSILLRNVTADELLVDNLQDHLVSVRADGVTEIGHTTVRTSAYIEDNTPDGLGLKYISMEAESYPEGGEPEGWEPPTLTLAGRIGEVINKTPGSTVHAAAGTVAKLTVDEAAEGSTVVIDRNTVVKELNLDTGVAVTGQGDIEKLVVNAPGSTVEMLPDEIVIRPGITATINGEEMDSVAAEESTMEPRILAGYPQAQDIIPTGLDAVFMTNKAGTVYWAVSAITDGSVGEEDLIKPPSYGNIAVRNGSVSVSKGNEEVVSKVTGLTPGGSYYLSAILVDARGQRSAVKVISFTTPDNTRPAFATGYPKMSKVSRADSVAVVMPTKDCKLYYVLLPQGATAPTEDELKTASVSGALGYGVRDVTKNVEDAFRINDVILDETTTYVVYFWLTDGINKSAITSLTFTTDDETPPEFIVDPTPEKQTVNSVSLKFQISEPGTVYWVAFPSDSGIDFPKRQPGTDYETAPLNSQYAIDQVVNGMNIGAEGKSGRVTVRANSDGACIGSFNITGMKPETTYEVYYVAKDNAGPDRNYSVTVKHITVTPLDETGPVFTQDFELKVGDDKTRPQANSDIYIDISEDVYYQGKGGSKSLLELYQETQTGPAASREEAVRLLAEILYKTIELHKFNAQNKREESIYRKYQTADTRDDWEIDYTKATVENRKGGGIRITFPKTGLQLSSGGQYCFKITDLEDMSGNGIEPNGEVYFWGKSQAELRPIKDAGHDVPDFIVEAPWIELGEPDSIDNNYPMLRNADGTISDEKAPWDMWFYMHPRSTRSVAENVRYDVLLWSRTRMRYDLYYRVVDADTHATLHTAGGDGTYSYPARTSGGDTNYLLTSTENKPVDENGWIYLGNSGAADPIGTDGHSGRAVSVSDYFIGCDDASLGRLHNLSENLEYQFFISLTENNHRPDRDTWSEEDTARIDVNVASGASNKLYQLGETLSFNNWEAAKENGDVSSIGRWLKNNEDTQELERKYSIKKLPSFDNMTPTFTPKSDGSLEMGVALDDVGKVHYAVFEINPQTGRSPLTTTREIMEGTSDYVKDANDTYVLSSDVELSGSSGEEMFITPTSPRPPIKSGAEEMPDWMVPVLNEAGELTNKVTSPVPTDITGGNFSATVIDSNNFSPPKNETGYVTIPAEKLTPGRTYFVYFVITAESDADRKSPVYIYQVTMPPPKKPSIIPSADADGNTFLDIDMLTAEDAFRITTSSNAINGNITFLQKSLSSYSDYPVDGASNCLPDSYKNYTVLQALTTPYSHSQAIQRDPDWPASGKISDYKGKYYYPDYEGDVSAYDQGYTVFDMFASNYARSMLYELIRNGGSLDPTVEQVTVDRWGPENNSFNTEAPDYANGETRLTTELKDKSGNSTSTVSESEYILLAYAINPDMKNPTVGGGLNSAENTSWIASFTALIFRKGKMEPPNVIDAVAGSSPFKKDGGVGTATYSGSVHIRFDRDVYLKGSNGSIEITEENLLTGRGVSTFGQDRNPKPTVTVSNISEDSFDINFSGVRSGESLSFPTGYFANSLNEENRNYELRITVSSTKITITWPGTENSPWEIPIQEEEESGEHTLTIRGRGLTGSGANRALQLPSSNTSEELTAMLDPEDLYDERYTWTTPVNDGVIQLQNKTGTPSTRITDNPIKIKALKPGTATVRVIGRGETEAGSMEEKEGSIDVTVTGKVDPLSSASTNSAATYDSSSQTLTMFLGTAVSPSATFTVKAEGEALSNTAAISAESSGANPGSVLWTPGANGTITITPARNAEVGHEATVEIGLKVAGGTTDLTPESGAKQTIRIVFEAAPPTTTTYVNRAPSQVTPTLSLSKSSLKLNSTSGMTATVTATVTATSNVSNTVQWSSSNPAVAAVTNTNRQVTITGKGAGEATITATLTANGKTLTRTVKVTVEPGLRIVSFTANNSNNSTVKANSDGTYTWTRKDGGSYAATLKFDAGMSLANTKPTIVSSDPAAVSQLSSSVTTEGTTGSVQLQFNSLSSSEVTITITAGSVKQTLKIKLAGGDVPGNLLTAKK